jgi:hypothetical protein
MNIYYGIQNNYIDVTEIIKTKNIKIIPADDVKRSLLFECEPAFGILKHILINNIVYDNTRTIKFDDDWNVIDRTILFTNARDESNIVEWVAHHKNIGFDFIYIYDHKSLFPIKYLFQNSSDIKIEEIKDENINKINLMCKAVEYSKNNYDWMLYLDSDEFLILKDDCINSFLKKYEKYHQIGINWLMFGSNFHNKKPKGTILENYTRCDSVLDKHIKCFVRPSFTNGACNPHYYTGLDLNLSVSTNFLKLNGPFSFTDISFEKSEAYIAHYIYQSFETFKKRKILRARDDTNTFRPHQFDEKTLHLECNSTLNEFPMLKYNDINKKTINVYLEYLQQQYFCK